MKKLHRTLPSLLVISMLCATFTSAVTVNAVEENKPEAEEKTVFELPDIVSEGEAKKYGYVGRVYEDEPNLNTFVFENSDGTNTMRVYSHPVKYYDKDGKIKDISLKLEKTENGGFIAPDNDVVTIYEQKLSDGISLSYDDVDVRMIPRTAKSDMTARLDEKAGSVKYVFDEKTIYEYKPTYMGFKEEIVVSKYTGQTEYDFSLYTNGLELCEDDSSFFLKDTARVK